MDRRVWLLVGSDRRELTASPCRGWESDFLPGESWETTDYLRRLVGRPTMMERLRSVLETSAGAAAVDQRSDEEIVEEVIRRIRMKRMCLIRAPIPDVDPWPYPVAISTPVSREPPPQQRSPAPRPVEQQQPQQPQGENFDQDRQADTLTVAAQNGTPFCEECAKQAA